MIAAAPIPTIAELRAEMARREAELAEKRAARRRAAWAVTARATEVAAQRRGMLESELADATARVATAAAMCEVRIEDRVTRVIR